MAVVTLTLTDTNVITGAFKCEFDIADAMTDDGKVTAAHITGNFLSLQVPQDSFRDGAFEFGGRLIAGLEEDNGGPLAEPTESRTLVLTLTDRDLAKGRYSVEVSGDGAADVRPTSAQIAGYYMRTLLSDLAFVQRVWAYADALVAGKANASIENLDYAPGTVPAANDAASLAA